MKPLTYSNFELSQSFGLAINVLFSKIPGRLLSFWLNTMRNEIGFYTDRMILQYKIYKETRNLWKFFLKNEDFHSAKEYCKVSSQQLMGKKF
jgi:hypothetical protein